MCIVNAYRDEHGAVAVFVAVLMLPLVLLMAFAIDTGHWWTHERHLQTQADAGAFASGQGPWFPACDEAAIEKQALASGNNPGDYSGGSYNQQYQTSGSVHVVLNSADYYDKGGSNFSDGGTPCETLANADENHPAFVDVKATESNLANFFGASPASAL